MRYEYSNRAWCLTAALVGAAASGCGGVGEEGETEGDWLEEQLIEDDNREPQTICSDCGAEESGSSGGEGSGSSGGGEWPAKADLRRSPWSGDCSPAEADIWVVNMGGESTHKFWVTFEFYTGSGTVYEHRQSPGLSWNMGAGITVPRPSNCIHQLCSGYRVRIDPTDVVDEESESNNNSYVYCN